MSGGKNILLIRLKSIGDILFTLPAVNAVRDNFPDAGITFLTSHENAALLRGFSAVDEIITIDRSRLRSPFGATREFFRILQRLRAGNFSLAIDFQSYGETAWLAWWTGASERWGGIYSGGRKWLFTRSAPRNDSLHQADWNLSLLEQCGLKIGEIRNDFVLPRDALADARSFLAERGLSETKPIFFIQPFTSSPHKNWPLKNYIEVARHFRSHGVQIIFGGGPADAPAMEPVRQSDFVVAAGTPLLTSVALTQLSTLILGGDTGLLHLAVAAGRRVAMLKSATGNSYPFRHIDWTIKPETGDKVSDIPITLVITACEKTIRD